MPGSPQAALHQRFYLWSMRCSRHCFFEMLTTFLQVKRIFLVISVLIRHMHLSLIQYDICSGWTKLALALGFAPLSPKAGWFPRPLSCLFSSLPWNTPLCAFSLVHPSSSVVLFQAYMFAMSAVLKEQSQVCEFSWTFRTGMVLLCL